ncbi:hypothetical protein [Tunturiibacter psychrotolerans]|uniref:hypothetical protein n=1 Tax=Tunturiibacter psychrotolerans TaxID=3069686 RepID=UPI003D21C925
MTEDQNRQYVSRGLVLSHLSIILLVMILWVFHGFTFSEMTTTVALIVPMFATYTATIVRSTIATRTRAIATSSEVSKDYALFSLLIPSVFVVCLFTATILKAVNIGFDTFDQFKIVIGLLEGIFGVYTGLFVTALFPKVK